MSKKKLIINCAIFILGGIWLIALAVKFGNLEGREHDWIAAGLLMTGLALIFGAVALASEEL